MATTIYVRLPRETVEVYAAVDAEHVRDDVYLILDCRNEDDDVEFGKGVLVRCRLQRLSEGETEGDTLVAYEPAPLH
jgi:hypothetical protein